MCFSLYLGEGCEGHQLCRNLATSLQSQWRLAEPSLTFQVRPLVDLHFEETPRIRRILAGSMTDSAGSFLFELDLMFDEGCAQTCLFPLMSKTDYLLFADLPLSLA